MNEKEYIAAWLNEMIAKFDWITFRYEYSHKLLAYCIEVLPANSIERSEEYANEEYNFSCDFEQKFNESVIFSNAQKMQLLLGKLDKKILNGLKMTALFLT